MKMRLSIFLFLLYAITIRAQEPSIHRQNFKGVKSVKFYSSESDSSGKILLNKSLTEEHFFDTLGRETRVLCYDKNVYYRTDDYLFDSLGRKYMHIIWTKKEGNKKYIYTYEDKGNYTLIRESLNKEITRTESNYWDTLQNLYIERAWYGASTMGAPPYQHKYNKDGRLVMAGSYNGFTEYRYDSLGTLNYMLMRQFEDGHCAGYSPFHYQSVYSGSRLMEYTSRWSTTTFTYDDKGFITVQKIRMNSENRIHTTEAEYVYYSE